VVAANIVRTGVTLVRSSMSGLMDKALPAEEMDAVCAVLDRYAKSGSVEFHALRTRKAGRRSFITVHVLVPGDWTVQAGHDFAERVEEDLRNTASPATVFTHLEPVEDPLSFADTELDRAER
jgi:divalent metal cation (Fe/Co/Zn/Cd) transporter